MHTHGVKLFFCTRLLFVFNDEGAAAKEPTELFTKNTGLCEHESGCIGADSCPVPEG
jgi:hypothetical protein